MSGTPADFFCIPFLASLKSIFAAPLVLRLVMLYSLILKSYVGLHDVHIQLQTPEPVSPVMMDDLIIREKRFNGAVKAHLIDPPLAHFR